MKHLLMDAKHEIETLRRRNEILQAKADVVEAFSAALLGRRPEGGMAMDVAWSLQREINRLNGEMPTEPANSIGDQVPAAIG